MKRFSLLIGSLLLIAGYSGICSAQVGTHWQRQFPIMHTYNGMATVGGITVAVGNAGEISTSPDGVNWTARNSGTDQPLYDVAGTTGKFVAVGAQSTLLFSQNGTDWLNISKSVGDQFLYTQLLNGVTWGNGEFVVVGSSGTILTSADGLNWTLRSVTGIPSFQSVAWNGTVYVAVGAESWVTPTVFTSPDGINWTAQTTTITYGLYDVAWNGTTFVAVGDVGEIATSTDGAAWTNQTSGTTRMLSSIIWTGTEFVTAGFFGTILTSATGTVWAAQTSPVNEDIQCLAPVGTALVAGTSSGSLFTRNGTTWSGAGSYYFNTCNDIAWNQTTTYAAVCGNGTFLSSTDTYSWTKTQPAGYGWLDSVLWDGAQFVSSGYSFLYTSTNGTTWAQSSPGAPFTAINNMLWDGTQYVAVGNNETVLTSTNLTAWTQQNYLAFGAMLTDIVQTAGKYVTYDYAGTILTSLDGIAWTPSSASGTYYGLTAMTWDGAQFVAVHANSILTSPDGNAWTPQTTNLPSLAGTATINKLVHNGTQYLAVGNFGTIFTSSDAITWNAEQSGTALNLKSALWDGTSYLAAGDNETILVSRDNGALPVITLNGQNTETFSIGNTYTDSGATATDVEDGNLTASILTAGSVDGYALGTYHINYGVADSNGNVASAIRTVIVADLTAPVVTAPPAITVEATGPTTTVVLDPGTVATALDNVDGLLTPFPDKTSFAVGVHTVIWSATDNAGNSGTANQSVTVTDTTPPNITISGGDLTLPQGASVLFISSGVTASDLVDGSLTGSIVQTGTVNMDVAGTYTATFTVTDSSGNSASANRKITIVGTGTTTPGSGSSASGGGGGGGGSLQPLMLILLMLAGIRNRRYGLLRRQTQAV